jgi:hypothetical protein
MAQIACEVEHTTWPVARRHSETSQAGHISLQPLGAPYRKRTPHPSRGIENGTSDSNVALVGASGWRFRAHRERRTVVVGPKLVAGERRKDAPGASSGVDTMKPSSLRKQGMSWRNVAKALEMPMSTVIDACRGCSENPPKREEAVVAQTHPLPAKRLLFDKLCFPNTWTSGKSPKSGGWPPKNCKTGRPEIRDAGGYGESGPF